MAKIETGRFSETLSRFLNLKGTEAVAGDLSPEVSPVFVLETDRPDWLFLKNEKLGVFATERSSGASVGPTCRLRNPAGSGVIATVLPIIIGTNLATSVIVRSAIINADLGGGTFPGIVRDTRWRAVSGISQSALRGSFITNVAPVGDVLFQGRVATDRRVAIKEPIVLSPGNAIDVGSTVIQAEALSVTFYYSERALHAIEAQ